MPVLSSNATLAYDSLAMTAYVRSMTNTRSWAMLDATRFGSSSTAVEAGLVSIDTTVEGLFESSLASGSLWSTLTAQVGSNIAKPFTAAPNGFSAGSAAFLLPAKIANLAVSNNVADLIPFTLTLGAGENGNYGICLTGLSALTASGNGSSQDNGASSANGAVANIHVTAASGTTPSITGTIEHSTNNSTWTTLATFSALTAAGSQTLAITGTVNRYVRAAYTISGTTPSFTTLFAIARF